MVHAKTCSVPSPATAPRYRPRRSRTKEQTLTNLGSVLSVCYGETQELDYLNQAIEAFQSSIDATPAGSEPLPARLDNLGAALDDRFGVTHDRNDLDRAIKV